MKAMKIFSKFVVGILLIISYPLVSHSQQGWFQQVSCTTLNLNSVYFIDANTGFVAADNGYILKTTNSGTNWALINTGANRKLYQIQFVNSTTGFAVGDTITYRSSDGGVTWNYVVHGIGLSISFVNQTTGFVMGFPFIACKTTNSGMNWAIEGVIFTNCGANKILFRNENTGYACGCLRSIISTYSAFIYQTTNSGVNWANIYTGPMSAAAIMRDIYFLNDSYGVALEDIFSAYYFHKTTNAGQNWNQIILPQQMNSVRFTDVNKGWTCGVNGGILFSSNGGGNWSPQASGVSVTLNELYMLNQNTGWIAGNNGLILKTTDGGPSAINPISNEIPSEYRLYQNYPNPFNPSTKIKFSVPAVETIHELSLRVYDILGREVATLVNEQLKPGSYEVEWDASNYPSGVYIYKLQTESFSEIKKMILLK
jgi:photosystem II stability/assembly factor-like uncharacterized protein